MSFISPRDTIYDKGDVDSMLRYQPIIFVKVQE